jgi:putative addiction module antidote
MTHTTIKIQRVGGSVGAILPKEVLEALHAEIGDTLHLVRTERGYELTAFDPDLDEAMAAFEVIRREHRNAFRELTK